MRIYKGPFWDLERVLPHPHRQFQHLTPIKATWHPLVDLVVAGRYPDPNFPGFIEGKKYIFFLEIRGFLKELPYKSSIDNIKKCAIDPNCIFKYFAHM